MKHFIKNYHLAFIALLLLFVTPCPVLRADEVDDYLKAQMKKNHIPGLAVTIIRNGKITKLKGYGLANLEWNQPVTPNTAFQLASSTKPFTGTALMLLVDEGKLSLGDKVAKYVPDAPVEWQDITIRHLATHSSGIRDDVELAKDATIEEYVKTAAKLPLSYRPGERSSYGISGYIVLRYIIEKVSGQAFPDFIKTRLVDRLGLTSTQFDFSADADGIRTSDVIKERASVYNWDNGKYKNYSFLFTERGYTAGGLLSSVADLAKLAVALDTGSLLSNKSLEQMWSEDVLADGRRNTFGVGWVVKNYNGRKTVGHSGGPALSDILRFPVEKLTIVVLTNGQKLYPYLAQGVADLFIPPPPLREVKGVEDNDPAITQMLKTMLLDATQEKVNDSLFTVESQRQFLPAFKTFALPFFKSLDPLQSWVLIEHKKTEKSILRRYRAVYGKKVIIWNFELSTDGKIISMEPSSE